MKKTKVIAVITSFALLSSISGLPIHAGAEDTSTIKQILVPELIRYASENFKQYQFDLRTIFDGWIDVRKQMGTYTIDDPLAYQTPPDYKYFDLRNVNGKNYVTPVKKQSPFGTCWAFAATAAAESSVACELGIDLNTADEDTLKALDFSERHLAWFSYTMLPDNSFYPSQAGETLTPYFCRNFDAEKYASDPNYARAYNEYILNYGGNETSVISMYSSKQGPVLESTVPYRNDENERTGTALLLNFTMDPKSQIITSYNELSQYVTPESLQTMYSFNSSEEYAEALSHTMGEFRFNSKDWYKGKGEYVLEVDSKMSSGGTWAVNEKDRFQGLYTPEQICILPSPCVLDENRAYQFDYKGLNAIKHELVSGRAVSIGIQSDKSLPDTPSDSAKYLQFIDNNGNITNSAENALYWCHYTYDVNYQPENPTSINRKVAVNHAVTIVGYDDTFSKEYFYDPNGTIGGDGAFIAKNSWGTDWGDQGYFYISYYDQSLDTPMTFDFAVDPLKGLFIESDQTSKILMYDLKPASAYTALPFQNEISMANVYTADEDTLITALGYTSVTNNETVNYEFYLLDDDAENPSDGELVANGTVLHKYAGYQQSDIDYPVPVKKGQRFSVVVTAQCESGAYVVETNSSLSFSGADKIKDLVIQELANSQKYNSSQFNELYVQAMKNFTCGKSTVNPGESYLRYAGQWEDWSNILQSTYADYFGENIDYDNFSIRAVVVPDITTENPPVSFTLGDVNSDGSVDIMDVIRFNKALLGVEVLKDTERQAADVDGNGRPESSDSLLILKYVLEMIDSFPVK